MSLPRFTSKEIEAMVSSRMATHQDPPVAIADLHRELQIGAMLLWPSVAKVLDLSKENAMRLVVRAIGSSEDGLTDNVVGK